jgi:hypothetical protein
VTVLERCRGEAVKSRDLMQSAELRALETVLERFREEAVKDVVECVG